MVDGPGRVVLPVRGSDRQPGRRILGGPDRHDHGHRSAYRAAADRSRGPRIADKAWSPGSATFRAGVIGEWRNGSIRTTLDAFNAPSMPSSRRVRIRALADPAHTADMSPRRSGTPWGEFADLLRSAPRSDSIPRLHHPRPGRDASRRRRAAADAVRNRDLAGPGTRAGESRVHGVAHPGDGNRLAVWGPRHTLCPHVRRGASTDRGSTDRRVRARADGNDKRYSPLSLPRLCLAFLPINEPGYVQLGAVVTVGAVAPVRLPPLRVECPSRSSRFQGVQSLAGGAERLVRPDCRRCSLSLGCHRLPPLRRGLGS